MDQYDEFGNPIGVDVDVSDAEDDDDFFDRDSDDEDNRDGQVVERDDEMDVQRSTNENRIVLHEDKKYYPDAEEVYPGVKTVTLDEDAQDLSEPIIKPVKVKNFSVLLKEAPRLKYEADFMVGLMQTPALIRNVALLGHFHHGKTLFTDTLVQATHEVEWDPAREVRYTDARKDEQDRQLSVKSTPVTLVLDDLKDKSYLLNIVDCPGHVNFSDEVTAAIRAADGACIIVDAVEGVMMQTERHIKQALKAHLSVSLVITKMDRLILELKLPPQDAYYKLMHTIEEVNTIIANNNMPGHPCIQQRLSPELGNVCFASGQHGWSFTLDSFAQMYVRKHQNCPFSAKDLGKRLWGDWYVNPRTNSLTKQKAAAGGSGAARTFVSYILEPLYKIYSHVIGESSDELRVLFQQLDIRIKASELHLDPKPLLTLSLRRFFGPPRGFVSMMAQHVPSPADAAAIHVQRFYTGPLEPENDVVHAMRTCSTNSESPFMAHVMKLYSTPEGTSFLALTRIFSGRVSVGQRIKVLGEAYTEDDDEDMAVLEVTGVSVSMGRFHMSVTNACAGNLVLLQGIDHPIKKTATLCDTRNPMPAIFAPLKFDTSAVIKLAVEPHIPAELPKMVEALRRINKSYPLVTTKVEESGEHVILGTGELYLDCIMHDLRHVYSDIEVKVADPVVSFCETVVDSSALNMVSETPNKKNAFTFVAEPLDEGLGVDIERGRVSLQWDAKRVGEFFTKQYDWDLLTARSIWAFGPDGDSPNVLINNTLPSEVPQSVLSTVKESVVQGFRWGTREGPLCDEPIRNAKFRILDAQVAGEAIYRGGGQIIPTARRSVYASMLLATPRIMEPVLSVEIQAPADCVQAVFPVLARRRGHVVQDAPKPGAPFYTIKAFIPAMDSFGFETDLRSYTLGQVFCQQVFDHWAVVPGDPLDRNVILHPLEPSPPLALARDFMVKTRRRKGLSEDVSVNKYLDEAMLLRLARHEAEMGTVM